ncbi:MAG: hypothetical protein R3F62_27580 [Planctomycetota bacterium]
MATPRPVENEISTTTFLIGAVVVVGVFIALQIGRVIVAPAPQPEPAVVEPQPDTPDPVEEPEEPGPPPGPVERPHEYDPPIEGKVEYDADRKRFVVELGFGSEDERAIVELDQIAGLEREGEKELYLRAQDGRRVAVTQEFIDELPTRVRYSIDYEASGNVATDGKGNPVDEDGRVIEPSGY